MLREHLALLMLERGRDFEGSDLIKFLRFMRGLRSRSRKTAWSRPVSRKKRLPAVAEGS